MYVEVRGCKDAVFLRHSKLKMVTRVAVLFVVMGYKMKILQFTVVYITFR